ncbi:MAG: hypothetical protein A3G34_10450 [Candidatus Lindowbacteria bacterium RIFCSPLOWO2_12_FULL_62_27]|nr:MAG: hypothetical protein A3G34_10450 [Candidatus Lindowbacteria bacterium RIFCSPLOWO2_12_FULL_62_27]
MSSSIHRIGKSGIPVFCDGRDPALDNFRLTESDPRKVILAVALSHARAVAIAYMRKHAPHLLTEMDNLLPPMAEKEHAHGFP